jgi:hypothetical protein
LGGVSTVNFAGGLIGRPQLAWLNTIGSASAACQGLGLMPFNDNDLCPGSEPRLSGDVALKSKIGHLNGTAAFIGLSHQLPA